MSGYPGDAGQARADGAPADIVIPKPLRLEMLLRAVRAALDA